MMKSEEIARLAGVSRSTVSRVINNYPNVPEQTRKRVMKVIEQYEYEPNTSAQVLAGKQTNTIGLFLFSVFDPDNKNRIYGNSYFAPLIDAIVDIGNYAGYYMLVHTIYNPEECWKIRQTFSQKRIDGGIVIGTEKSREIEAMVSQLSYPLVLVDYDPKEIKKLMHPEGRIAVINTDDQKGINACVDHLVKKGHRQIAFIEGRTTTYSGLKRRESFINRMAHYNLPIEDHYILKGDFTGKTAAASVEHMIDRGDIPSAVIVSNDEMAIAAIGAFQAHGIRVPEDISVIGYDDAAVSALVKPSLTTVKIPFYEMAQKAIQTLTGLMTGEQAGFENHNIDVELIIRESTN